MKDKIRVGDYIRTYKGDIAKVIGYIKSIHYNTSYNEDCAFVNYEVDKLCGGSLQIAECDIKNYASNKIDLTEKGDILKVKDGDAIFCLGIEKEDTEATHQNLIDTIKNKEVELLSIATKEQFKSIEYEV